MKNDDFMHYGSLKQLCRFALMNYNIYIVAYPAHVDVDHSAHVWASTMFTQRIMRAHLL